MNEELIERLRMTEQMLNVAHFKEAESLIREACDAIEELQSKLEQGRNHAYYKGVRKVKRILSEQPTADVVERKKGKWEMRWHYFFHAEVPVCSQCLKVSPFKTDFCPRCGADMRGETDGNS